MSPRSEPRPISDEARALARDAEIVDLHVDTFIPIRAIGYSVLKRHGPGLHGGRFFGHLDVPRMRDGGLKGAMWSITTNPFRTARGRWVTFQKNLARLRAVVDGSGGALAIARTSSEYREVRARGAHAVLVSVQGGNAFDAAPGSARAVPDHLVTRVTLVHLTSSAVGCTSTPLSWLRRDRGLGPVGRELVRALNDARAFVDLAHIHPDGFWDAVEVHDKSQPLIATHTGVSGVTPHWRNLDDRQLRAIADTGGTVGIIFSKHFLRRPGGPSDGQMVIDHVAHVIDTVGEDFVSLGSDYDGAIIPPWDLKSGDSYPRLVQHMLDRGWGDRRIEKILGLNFLRAFGLLRP
ncbi:dipeptidase [Myxococcota bacterium]|nr:dipeptidase [Myxococcota bacterium]